MIDLIKQRMEKAVKKKQFLKNVNHSFPSGDLDFSKKPNKKQNLVPVALKTKKLKKKHSAASVSSTLNNESDDEVNQMQVSFQEKGKSMQDDRNTRAKLKKNLKSTRLNKNKQIRKNLLLESNFLLDVLKMMPIQHQNNDDDDNDEDSDVYLGNRPTKEAKEKTGKHILPGPSTASKRAQSLAELHERLQSKLAEFKGKQLDYGEKKKRQMLKKKLSKVDKRKRKNEERKLKKTLVHTVSKNQEQTVATPVAKPKKPIFNEEGQMVFSKFDFSESGSESRTVKKKDPKKILQNLQKDKEKIAELVSAGEVSKASHIIEKKSWKSALQKAEGVKVKDDVELVKKSITKVQQKKKHSAKKWQSRMEGIQKKQEDMQKKRKDNIFAKKKERKDKKMKKLVKKGRIVPGF